MTWSGWDVWVIVAGVAQTAGLGGVVWAALKIKNGPVKQVQSRVVPLIASGKALADAAQTAYHNNREQISLLLDEAKETIHSVRHAVSPPALSVDAPINYRKIGKAWAGLKTAQQGIGFLRRVATKRNTAASAKAALIERIGLVPPAGTPVRKVLRATRFVLRVRGLLKKSGVV